MRLNHDYVRDILLFIEQEMACHQEITHGELLSNNKFSKHNKEELTYALELLLKEQFIDCASSPYFLEGKLMMARIICLTWKGHELLDNIRNDTIWKSVKQKARKFGGFSLSTLSASAKMLTTALMSNPNAIQNFMDGIDNIGNMF